MKTCIKVSECNFKCAYCDISSFRPGSSDLRLYIANLKNHGVTHIHWTGGEPTLRQDLLGDVKYAHAMGIHQSMATNGSASLEYYKTLASAGLNRMNVSLDSLDKVVFQRLTGQRIITPVEVVHIIKEMAKVFSRPVKVNIVVSTKNYKEVKAMYEVFADDTNVIPRFLEFAECGNRNMGKENLVPITEVLTLVRSLGVADITRGKCYTNPMATYHEGRYGLFAVVPNNIKAELLDLRYTPDTGCFSIVKYI